jgi:hypothetical protein
MAALSAKPFCVHEAYIRIGWTTTWFSNSCTQIHRATTNPPKKWIQWIERGICWWLSISFSYWFRNIRPGEAPFSCKQPTSHHVHPVAITFLCPSPWLLMFLYFMANILQAKHFILDFFKMHNAHIMREVTNLRCALLRRNAKFLDWFVDNVGI